MDPSRSTQGTHLISQPRSPPMFFQPPSTHFRPLQPFIQPHHNAPAPWHQLPQTFQPQLRAQPPVSSYHSEAQHLVFPQHHEELHGRQPSITGGDSASVSTADSLTTPKLDLASSSSSTGPLETAKIDAPWAQTWTNEWTSTTPVAEARASQSPVKLPAPHPETSSIGPVRNTKRQIPTKSKSTSVITSEQPVRKGARRRAGGACVPVDGQGCIKPPTRPITVQPHLRPDKETTNPAEGAIASSWPFQLHALRPSDPPSTPAMVPDHRTEASASAGKGVAPSTTLAQAGSM